MDVRSVFDCVLAVLLCGAAAYYVTRLVRILPVVRTWVAAGRKPFVCDTCMAFWTNAALVCIACRPSPDVPASVGIVVVLAGAALTLFVLERDRPKVPPRLPPAGPGGA